MERALARKTCLHVQLAELIVNNDIMMGAIAVAGEIITLNARLSDYDGPMQRDYGRILEDLSPFEAYEAAAESCKVALTKFSKDGDVLSLLGELNKCKRVLAELSLRE